MSYLTVLIAYNDENITRLLSTIIETRYDAHIAIAKYEKSFFQSVSERDYDVILMDSSFSKDAFEIIRDLRCSEKNSKVPVALFISHLTEDSYVKAVELDIFDFLSRPFSLDHIYLSLDYILHQKGSKEAMWNKRTSVRCDKRLYVKYLRKDGLNMSDTAGSMLTTDNISVGGIRLSGAEDLSINDELDVEIMLENPYDNSNIHARGIVKWTDEKRSSVGIAFNKLSNPDRLKLSNTLYAH
ncbi:response regulator [Thermodesulfobacteriota bacterium]